MQLSLERFWMIIFTTSA